MGDANWRTEEEKEVKAALAELRKAQVLSTDPTARKLNDDGRLPPVSCPLELGLRCVILQERMGNILKPDDRTRLANRLNVLLRMHRPFGIDLEVKA